MNYESIKTEVMRIWDAIKNKAKYEKEGVVLKNFLAHKKNNKTFHKVDELNKTNNKKLFNNIVIIN